MTGPTPTAMLSRHLSSSVHLYNNIHHLVPPIRSLLTLHQHTQQQHSQPRNSRTMTAAAAHAASSSQSSSNAQAAASSSASEVVIYDRDVCKRTIRGVVFDMDGTLTVPVIDFQYMRQVGCTPFWWF